MALPLVRGDVAIDAVEGMARDHPLLAQHIRGIGALFLRHADGLRVGRNGASRTYDLSFVNDAGAFACLTAEPGKHDSPANGRLQVQVRCQGECDLKVFVLKSTPSEIARGWYAAQLGGGDDIVPLLADIRSARIASPTDSQEQD